MIPDREPFDLSINHQPVEIGPWVMIELVEEFGLSHDAFRVAKYVGRWSGDNHVYRFVPF